jgi:hypothetical protein
MNEEKRIGVKINLPIQIDNAIERNGRHFRVDPSEVVRRAFVVRRIEVSEGELYTQTMQGMQKVEWEWNRQRTSDAVSSASASTSTPSGPLPRERIVEVPQGELDNIRRIAEKQGTSVQEELRRGLSTLEQGRIYRGLYRKVRKGEYRLMSWSEEGDR